MAINWTGYTMDVFPARAGMNRVALGIDCRHVRVPRASGDEPVSEEQLRQLLLCSPRERG